MGIRRLKMTSFTVRKRLDKEGGGGKSSNTFSLNKFVNDHICVFLLFESGKKSFAKHKSRTIFFLFLRRGLLSNKTINNGLQRWFYTHPCRLFLLEKRLLLTLSNPCCHLISDQSHIYRPLLFFSSKGISSKQAISI